ncbi:hypothetical protein GH714_036447 [Hevea brasiliensis]|uniref:Uncharacterized protein n=1 Tax=Hevea brasiliensis TaxID=3981 RepID=A0A6A6M5S3_HEVBR|nr:hypothetical protein GH714_036447 [Hevea brasiliensis]
MKLMFRRLNLVLQKASRALKRAAPIGCRVKDIATQTWPAGQFGPVLGTKGMGPNCSVPCWIDSGPVLISRVEMKWSGSGSGSDPRTSGLVLV